MEESMHRFNPLYWLGFLAAALWHGFGRGAREFDLRRRGY